jgi:Flp pilus assembly protein TadB
MTTDDVPENADVCIIGHETVRGKASRVKDDRVLNLMKAAKQKLGMKLKNNRLFVCEKHKEEYMKKRKGFERNVLLLSALAAVFFVIIFVVNLSSGDVADILRALLLGVLLVLMVPIFLIFTYVPAIEDGKETKKAQPQKRGGKK